MSRRVFPEDMPAEQRNAIQAVRNRWPTDDGGGKPSDIWNKLERLPWPGELLLAQDEGLPPDESAVQQSLTERTVRVVKTLTPREEMIIARRYGSDETLEEVAEACGVTRERIRQIEAKALRKLRHPSRSKRLKVFVDGLRPVVFYRPPPPPPRPPGARLTPATSAAWVAPTLVTAPREELFGVGSLYCHSCRVWCRALFWRLNQSSKVRWINTPVHDGHLVRFAEIHKGHRTEPMEMAYVQTAHSDPIEWPILYSCPVCQETISGDFEVPIIVEWPARVRRDWIRAVWRRACPEMESFFFKHEQCEREHFARGGKL